MKEITRQTLLEMPKDKRFQVIQERLHQLKKEGKITTDFKNEIFRIDYNSAKSLLDGEYELNRKTYDLVLIKNQEESGDELMAQLTNEQIDALLKLADKKNEILELVREKNIWTLTDMDLLKVDSKNELKNGSYGVRLGVAKLFDDFTRKHDYVKSGDWVTIAFIKLMIDVDSDFRDIIMDAYLGETLEPKESKPKKKKATSQ